MHTRESSVVPLCLCACFSSEFFLVFLQKIVQKNEVRGFVITYDKLYNIPDHESAGQEEKSPRLQGGGDLVCRHPEPGKFPSRERDGGSRYDIVNAVDYR